MSSRPRMYRSLLEIQDAGSDVENLDRLRHIRDHLETGCRIQGKQILCARFCWQDAVATPAFGYRVRLEQPDADHFCGPAIRYPGKIVLRGSPQVDVALGAYDASTQYPAQVMLLDPCGEEAVPEYTLRKLEDYARPTAKERGLWVRKGRPVDR